MLLQTATALASKEDGTKTTRARILFDNGSHRSYVTQQLKLRLNLKSYKTETLHLNTFGEQKYRKQRCEVVKIRINKPGFSENDEVQISALSFPVICSAIPSKVDVSKFPHLESLELADDFDNGNDDSIDILIGSDHYWNIVQGETIRSDSESGPIAVRSKLGWILSGPSGESVESNIAVSNLVITGDFDHYAPETDQLENTLKKFWETIGIKDEVQDANTDATDDPFLRKLVYDGKRYEVGLPWNENVTEMSDHYNLCFNRLKNMQRKLRDKPELLTEYDRIIQDQLKAGIMELAPKPSEPEQAKETEDLDKKIHEEASKSPTATKIHYMPHHPVIRQERETTKLRIVYDGSAKPSANELSINDCLQPGPNFIPKLFDVLIKFRSHSVALTGDIEKAFLMIGIDESDRDMLRFLWFKDPHELNSELVQLRFTRLAFGLRPSPSILGATISHHLNKHREAYPKLVDAIEGSLYVDDLLTGEETDDRTFQVYENSKKLMSQGGLNLRKWNSNSPTLLAKIKEAENQTAPVEASKPSAVATVSEEDESYAKTTTSSNSTMGEEIESYTKLLGIIWDSQSDEFTFDFSELITYISKLPVNKRSLLKFTAKIFDPLGFLSPFVIRLKMMFQVLCTDKLPWDDPIQGDKLNTWNSIVSEVQSLNGIRIPRCYFQERSTATNIQLHAFSDASEKAYAAAVYLRSTHSDGQVETRLIACKTRVAPIKTQTIPRLELLGAVILSRLVDTIQRSLPVPVNQVFYWVDSRVVLCWIQNEKPWKQYVRHRVDEIHRLTDKSAWKHCPGSLNPADLPSRGLRASELANSQLWWNGPPFLQETEDK